MKISDVKTYILGTAWRNLTYVEVHTDAGLIGVGEVRMLNHTDALIGYFAEAVPNHILGSDPFNVEDLVQRMFRNDYARAGEIAMSAISTVEMACWDIVGKALNQPCIGFWAARYASASRPMRTAGTRWSERPKSSTRPRSECLRAATER